MPCSYLIDAESGLAELTAYGKVSKDEVIERFGQVFSDPGWEPGYRVISDCTAADLREILPADLDELLAVAVSMRDQLAGSKFAIVVASDLHFALFRMYGMKGGEHIMDMACFKSRREAYEWLDGARMVKVVQVEAV